MCFMHRSAANKSPLQSSVELFRASTKDAIRIPYMHPLYWKWMWSMMRRPGESRMEMAAACAARFDVPCAESINLVSPSSQQPYNISPFTPGT